MLFVYGRKEDKYSLIIAENSIYQILNVLIEQISLNIFLSPNPIKNFMCISEIRVSVLLYNPSVVLLIFVLLWFNDVLL